MTNNSCQAKPSSMYSLQLVIVNIYYLRVSTTLQYFQHPRINPCPFICLYARRITMQNDVILIGKCNIYQLVSKGYIKNRHSKGDNEFDALCQRIAQKSRPHHEDVYLNKVSLGERGWETKLKQRIVILVLHSKILLN